MSHRYTDAHVLREHAGEADVTQKVQKFLDDLTPATPEEIAESN